MNHAAVWAVSGATVLGILTRPRGVPEWCWALLGAGVLLLAGLLPAGAALGAILDGLDVYLFLAGMLALSELARTAGVFDWLAALVVPAARGRISALFAWIYVLGIVVTALLSNDATVLLLTPAVLAVVRRAGAPPLPFLFACALVANAASFVLPISNPANLVFFHTLPRLGPWLAAFGLASVVAVTCTYFALRILYRDTLRGSLRDGADPVELTAAGKRAAAAVGISALLLIVCAGLGFPVGRAAFILGALSLATVAPVGFDCVRRVMRESPWSIIPLVAGLFVIVAALDRSGVLALARAFIRAVGSLPFGQLIAGGAVAVADNIFNNLPVGTIARYAVDVPNVPAHISHAILVAVDLGPNFTIAGSLATLLWIIALRREGIVITSWQFFRAGIAVTLPALLLALLLVR